MIAIGSVTENFASCSLSERLTPTDAKYESKNKPGTKMIAATLAAQTPKAIHTLHDGSLGSMRSIGSEDDSKTSATIGSLEGNSTVEVY